MLLKILKKYNRYDKNEEVEVSDATAKNLLKRGVADVVKEEKKKASNKGDKAKLENK